MKYNYKIQLFVIKSLFFLDSRILTPESSNAFQMIPNGPLMSCGPCGLPGTSTMAIASVGDGCGSLSEAGIVIQPPGGAVAETTQISKNLEKPRIFRKIKYFPNFRSAVTLCPRDDFWWLPDALWTPQTSCDVCNCVCARLRWVLLGSHQKSFRGHRMTAERNFGKSLIFHEFLGFHDFS